MMEKEKIKSGADLTVRISLILSETEARALEAITGYGTDSFLKVFYKSMGEHYLRPHEQGVVSLFDTVRKELPQHLSRADDARAVFRREKKAVDSDRVGRIS